MTSEIRAPHHLPVRVYYEDTDAEGLVYYSNYLRFAERGRTEFLRELGYDHNKVNAEHNMFLVVCHLDIDYRAPAKLDDLLDVATEVTECRNSSLTMRQIVRRGEKILTQMNVVIVAVSPSGKPVRLPPQLRHLFVS